MREFLRVAHWIDDLWGHPATPRFRIYLDNADMSDDVPEALNRWEPILMAKLEAFNTAAGATLGYPAHITCVAYLSAEPFRLEREKEWGVPDEWIEPAKSTTARSPINWNI